MKIRTAAPEDIDSLVNFNQKMAQETEGKYLENGVLRNGVSAVFQDENKGFYVVADDGGAIVGGLMVTFEWSDWRDKWFWWIQSVYIVPSERGKRIYGDLYASVKTKADERGNVCGFRLYVEKENLRAQRVYERVGMKRADYLMYEEKIKPES